MCNKKLFATETVYYCLDCSRSPLYEICEECFDFEYHNNHRYIARTLGKSESRVCHCGSHDDFIDTKIGKHCKMLSFADNSVEIFDLDVLERQLECIFNYILDVLLQSDTSNYSQLNKYFMMSANVINIYKQTDANGVKNLERLANGHCLILEDSCCNSSQYTLANELSSILDKPIEYCLSLVDEFLRNKSFQVIAQTFDLSFLEQIQAKLKDKSIPSKIITVEQVVQYEIAQELIAFVYILLIKCNYSMNLKIAVRKCLLNDWESSLYAFKNMDIRASTLSSCDLDFMSSITQKCSVIEIPIIKNFFFSDPNFYFDTNNLWQYDTSCDLKINEEQKKQIFDYFIHNTKKNFLSKPSKYQYFLDCSSSLLTNFNKLKLIKILESAYSISGDDFNIYAASQYLDLYPKLIYQYFISDQASYKASILTSMSQYIFQNPKVTNLLVHTPFFSRMIKLSFFLINYSSDFFQIIDQDFIPCTIEFKLPSSDKLQSRKIISFYKDIYLAFSSNTNPKSVFSNQELMDTIFCCARAFKSIVPLKREELQHVEYESFDFQPFFQFFNPLIVMIDSYIRSICLWTDDLDERAKIINTLLEKAVNEELKDVLSDRGVSGSGDTYLENSTCSYDGDYAVSDVNFQLNMNNFKLKTLQVSNEIYKIIDFKVGVDIQSFIHPFSYIIKFILQWSCSGRYEKLPDDFRKKLMGKIFELNKETLFCNPTNMLLLCEHPISTLAMISQIRSGFWIRNGAPIVLQMKKYTKDNLKEYTYYSDLFITQLGMCYCLPNEFMCLMIDRFNLRSWFMGIPLDDYPDRETTVKMVEEMFLVLIRLFTDIRSLSLLSSFDGFEKNLITEIVHVLCFKDESYSKVSHALPEHLTRNPSFDLYLKKAADFFKPKSDKVPGLYRLKPKYFDMVDPFYVTFGASQSYEAEIIVRKRQQITHGINNYNDTFIPVRNIEKFLNNKLLFKNLFAICGSDNFGMWIKNSLELLVHLELESLATKVIHLIHICVVNSLHIFEPIFWREYQSSCTLDEVYRQSIGSLLYSFLQMSKFSNEHGKIREIFRFMKSEAPHIDINKFLEEQVQSFNKTILETSNFYMHNEYRSESSGFCCLDSKDSTTSFASISSTETEFERKKKIAKAKREKMMDKLKKQQSQFIENNLEYIEDFVPSSRCESTKTEWEYPEDTCTFCKIPRNETPLVYFGLLIDNLVDEFGDVSNFKLFSGLQGMPLAKGSQIKTQQCLTVKFCGHGSHPDCLLRHMDSQRLTYSQITKNITSAIGNSCFMCPLCSSLSNWFIPKINTMTLRTSDYLENFSPEPIFAGNEFQSELKWCAKSLSVFSSFIFQRESISFFDARVHLNQLMINTVKNIELSLRRKGADDEFIMKALNNQKLTTLKLLGDFEFFCINNSKQLAQLIRTHRETNEISESFDDYFNNLEKFTSTDPLKIINFALTGETACAYMKKLGYKSLILTIVKRSLLLNFVRLFTALKVSSFKLEAAWMENLVFPREHHVLVGLIKKFLDDNKSSFPVKLLDEIKKNLPVILDLVLDQLKVLLRRIALCVVSKYFISFHADVGSITKKINHVGKIGEINQILGYLGVDKIEGILKNLEHRHIQIFKMLINDELVSKKQLDIPLTSPFQLSVLPERLCDVCPKSYSLDYELKYKAFKNTDSAICLFCSKMMWIEHSPPWHNSRFGKCCNHVYNECAKSSSFGCFLLPKTGALLLLFGMRGTFYPAPYLNEHHEYDLEKLGTVLKLNEDLYEKFTNDIVLGSKIPDKIISVHGMANDFGGWEQF
ncbi:uncharacterized protein SCODWIG_00586 [Saccharomycodes ludwigii]|uniref:E3 ubiquitin-protein ligase n=1 Tax=Saccharomycodes ludwigii TaxID=36035 RepID=A0A376B2A7_9ASCO|nr:uncharacterized protein SCODWIG_00586 [Saccharomycodes ludwigii]